jgi:hypothetical protein
MSNGRKHGKAERRVPEPQRASFDARGGGVIGQSLALMAALAALVACVVVDTYGGAASAVLVPLLMLVAVLGVGAAALRELRRAR